MSSLEIDYDSLEACYIRQLKDTILPFWQKNSYDSEYGGFFTCFSNDGSRLLSTDKYTWSQGRIVWVLSKLSKMDLFSQKEKSTFLSQARHTLEFMLNHCFLDQNMTCAFLVSREGLPIEQEEGLGLAPSTFADCFVSLAMIAYMDATHDLFCFKTLEKLFQSILHRYRTGNYHTSPFYLPSGARYHAIPMILLNICNEYGDFLDSTNQTEQSNKIYGIASDFCDTILDTFVLADGTLLEMVNPSRQTSGHFLYSYVNPGHVLEDCWFMLLCAAREKNSKKIQRILSIIDKSYQLGWDSEYGGIRYYVHKDGGIPRGLCENAQERQTAEQICADCNDKLWWPNTEAMYTALLAYYLSDNSQYFDMFLKVHTYTLRTFPNPDKTVGEWIQLRDQKGAPFLQNVGGRLPVKDPYHIPRNLILLIDLVRKLKEKSSA